MRAILSGLFTLLSIGVSAGTIVQFGGDKDIVTNANFIAQIGADEVIQWNGVNSWGGSFGANGTVNEKPIGATLWSSNSAVTLTSLVISSTDAAGTNTFATGTPNILGIKGGANAQFEKNRLEEWTFDFDGDINLRQLVIANLGADNEEVVVTIEGQSPLIFSRTNANAAAVTYGADTTGRYVYTYPSPVSIPAGTNVTIGSTGATGGWSLQGFVFEIPDAAPTTALIQFGGGSGNVTNANYQAQIGADQIIQWNGVNSWGGSANANGNVGGSGQGVGATLWSSNNVLTLTSQAISSTDAAGTNTVSTDNPNILGVKGGADARFDVSNSEAWTFDFDQDVTLKYLIVSAVDGAADMPTINVAGITNFAMTSTASESAAVTWDPVTKRFVWTFSDGGLAVPAGTDITLSAVTGGQWGLQGVVVEVETSTVTVPYQTLIDFGGNPDLYTNSTYQAETGGDEIIAFWGGDILGRLSDEIGTLKNQGVGGALTSATYNVAITTLAISSSNAARTNTVVDGGQLGINFADSFNASFEAVDDTVWTFEFNDDVWLTKVGFKGLTGGSEEALVVIGGVSNTITAASLTSVSYGSESFYTFAEPVAIPAGTDITVSCPVGKWGLANLLVGVDQPPVVPVSYESWLTSYPSLGSATNLTDNPDGDALNNLYEFAQGGDPTVADSGNASVYAFVEDGGTNYMDYVYYRRKDYNIQGLTYGLELTESLTIPAWTNAGYEVAGTANYDADFRAVTNRVPVDTDTKFLQLLIDKN